jgi:hypothetical protein
MDLDVALDCTEAERLGSPALGLDCHHSLEGTSMKRIGQHGIWFVVCASSGLLADTQVLEEPLVRGVVIPEVTPHDSLGADVGGIGDFDGDGIGDFAISATPFHGIPRSSSVYLVLGRVDYPDRFDLSSDPRTIHIVTDERGFGFEVLGAGDLDGDGRSDVYIHQANTSGGIEPRIYLLYGSAALPPVLDKEEIGVSVRGAVLRGSSIPGRSLSNPIAAIRDFNGDGRWDLAFGSPSEVGSRGERGKATIVFGEASFEGEVDLDDLIAAGKGLEVLGTPFSDSAFEGLGHAIAPAGDVNGDGLTDVVIADPQSTTEIGEVRGRVCLIHGSRSPPPVIRTDDLTGRGVIVENYKLLSSGEMAMTVFGGEDLDQDGFAELGLSLQEESGFGGPEGRLLIVRGGAQLPARISFAEIEDGSRGFEVKPTNPQAFGQAVFMTPDEDGDGIGEIFAGRPANPGEALVLRGQYPIPQPAVDRPLHLWKSPSGQLLGEFIGMYMAPAGDVNGDAIPDYLLAAPDRFAGDDGRLGVVYLLFGGFESGVLSLQGIQPRRGIVGRSTEATISGTGFGDGMQVFFGDLLAEEVEVLDPHTVLVRTPLVDSPGTVDVKVVAGDSREAVLPRAFSFADAIRRFEAADLEGVVTFEAMDPRGGPSRLQPVVLGDVTGDGLEDYAFNGWILDAPDPSPGAAYIVRGGTISDGTVAEGMLREKSAIISHGGYAPEVFALRDLDRDGRREYAVAKQSALADLDGIWEFAVLFDAFPPGTEVDFTELRSHPHAAYFRSPVHLGFYVQSLGDFDGDGEEDLLARTGMRTARRSYISIVYGPVTRGTETVLDPDAGDGRALWIVDSANDPYFMYVSGDISPAGDLNGDGLGDLGLFQAASNVRGVIVLLGHPTGAHTLDMVTMLQDGTAVEVKARAETLSNTFIKPGGDIDGDGFGDLLVHGYAYLDVSAGYASVLRGRADVSAGMTWEGETTGEGGFFIRGAGQHELFGFDAASEKSIDGDSIPDLVVGSFGLYELGSTGLAPGTVRIVHGVADLRGDHGVLDLDREITVIEGVAPSDRFGRTVEVLGDQDGDGLPELLVEASFESFSAARTRGLTFLIPGKSLLGAPGPVFVRGDSDRGGDVNITDAIRILGVLFLGEGSLPCADAADANDDGSVNLTDPIYILNFLFQGTSEPPPAPYPDPGPDPTPDSLECSA